MHKSTRLMVTASLAAMLAALALPAMAQQPPNSHEPAKKPAVQGQPGRAPGGGVPGQRGPAGPAHGPGPGAHGPGPGHAMHAVGERGYSFHGPGHGRRELATFNERERAVWFGGHWRHEYHGGRLGYWWEVNGVWYFYDQPMAGPPAYVSEVEFLDDPGAAAVVVAPAPVVVVPAPVVVAPAPVVVVRPPPVVCVGPLCVR
jgi:hypothetical protein